jgi:hypothetical protein
MENNSENILIRKLKGINTIGKPEHGWEIDIQVGLKETWCEGTK